MRIRIVSNEALHPSWSRLESGLCFFSANSGNPIDGSYMSEWPVLAHINAVSLLDEGTEAVLDILQHSAAATGVLLAVHGFNPEVMDRGRTWPGHGPKGSSGSLGGLFARSAPGVYDDTSLGSPRVQDAPYASFDALAKTNEVGHARGLDVYLYILESAGTGGYQRNISGWPRVLEIDIAGRRDVRLIALGGENGGDEIGEGMAGEDA